MSVNALTWSFNVPLRGLAVKGVLNALADHADPHGRCWPSVDRLARYAGCDAKTARKALRDLEALGAIRREARSGKSDMFELVLSWAPDATAGDAEPLPKLAGVPEVAPLPESGGPPLPELVGDPSQSWYPNRQEPSFEPPVESAAADEAFDLYVSAARQHHWVIPRKLDSDRRKALMATLKEWGGLDAWREALAKAAADLLRDIPRAVICTFDDEHGQALRANVADTIGAARCQWVTYPQGCSDLPGTLRKFGARGVQETIARARWYSMPGFYSMSELPEPPINPAFGTGIVGLDDHMRLRRGDLTIISGVPGAGKTTFANEAFCRLALSRGFRTIWASFEQRSKPDHRTSLRTFHAGKPETIMSPAEKAAADAWIDEHFRFLVPDDDTEASLDWLLDMLGAAVTRFDPFAIVIDPWNALEHKRPNGMTMTEYTGVAIERIKRFARKRRVHVAVVAHPAKMQRNRDGEYPKPTLYDIADSAHWANKADLGVMVWRKTGDTEAEIAVVKSRYYRELGTPGAVKGIYEQNTARLTITDDGGMQ